MSDAFCFLLRRVARPRAQIGLLFQEREKNEAVVENPRCTSKATKAADAAMTIGTIISAPTGGLLLLIAKLGEMMMVE